MKLLAVIALVAVANASAQNVKSVRGNYATKGFHHNQNMVSLFGNHSQSSYQNGSLIQERDIGVCYIEVPTASIAKDSTHIPAGNGSRPDLSRIRTCCHGYIRNIHNYWICDPVCSEECVNALCTAPEVCTCFPDHVKNEAGYCVATCPIGCQNGHCDGGECMCKDGYKLHRNGLYCVPVCNDDCGGGGNCTAPQTCTCKPGYENTGRGTCKAHCLACANGDCVGPNECRCRTGYYIDEKGDCKARCERGCSLNGICTSPNVCTYPNGIIAPSGQEPHSITTTTTSKYPNYPYPPNTPPNYYQPGSSNSSRPGHGQNPIYYIPLGPNTGQIPADNQIANPANKTGPQYSNQSQYPHSPGDRNPSNYPAQDNSSREPSNPDRTPILNKPLAPYPNPTDSNSPNPNNQPGYPYLQNQNPPGYFFNPYGGYYMPIYPNYGSNYGKPMYPNHPGYPPANSQQPPNRPGVNSPHNCSGSESCPHGQNSTPNQNYPTYPQQPGYPYPSSSFPQQTVYYQGYPHPPGYNQPGYNQYGPHLLPGQPGYFDQTGQPRRPGQPDQLGPYDQVGRPSSQPGQPGQSGTPGQPGIPGQPGQPGTPGQPGQSGTPNSSSYISYNQFGQSYQPGQAQYNQFGEPIPVGQLSPNIPPGQSGYVTFINPNQPQNANQLDYNQSPTQISNQAEYFDLPKYINLTDFLKENGPGGPAFCMTHCTNAGCAPGNRCVCYEGYVALTDGSRCKPVCRGCFNGVCTAPNECVCNRGYFRDPSIKGGRGCVVKRQRRSVAVEEIMPLDVGKLLVYELPEEDY